MGCDITRVATSYFSHSRVPVQRQQRLPAKGHDQRFLFFTQHRGAGIFRSHPRIFDGGPLPPLGHRLGVDSIARRQLIQTRLTMLYRSTHCRCRAGASVEYLSHKTSHDGNCSYFTPAHCGTKQLASANTPHGICCPLFSTSICHRGHPASSQQTVGF
jgi:hypothetical protein